MPFTEFIDEMSWLDLVYILALIGLVLFLVSWFFGAQNAMTNFLEHIFTAFYLWQGRVQSRLRPGIWFPYIRSFHSHKTRWLFNDLSTENNRDRVLGCLMNVISQDRSSQNWIIDKIDYSPEKKTAFVRVFVFTWAKWMDIIEITILGNDAKVHSFSSGFLPMCIPFAFIFNMIFSWIPFSDLGLNKKRVDKMKRVLDEQVTEIDDEEE